MANVIINDTHLTDIADSIRNKNGTNNKYKPSEMAGAIDSITTKEDLDAELTEQSNLLSSQGNAIDDIKLALQGKTAGGVEEIVLQEKTVTPTTSQQNVVADSDYNGLSKVVVNAVTSAIDSDIKATNIKKGVNILGVTGTVEEGITPSGTLNITENGTHDVTNYASVKVDIASGDGDEQLLALIDKSITDLSNEKMTKVGAYAFYNCTSLTSINIPNATTIDSAAFRGCTKLSTINIPSVTSIGTNAFMNCSSLKSMSLSVVPTINTSLFYACTSLESVNFPDATSVKNDAFRSCTKLKKVDLAKVTSINTQAFKDCSALEKLILRSTTMCTLANVSAFTGSSVANGTGYVYVTDSLLTQYQQATNWSTYASQIKGISELEG